ncbi:MAG: hypothetical protein ABJM62_08890, partial [Marinomonas sp.]
VNDVITHTQSQIEGIETVEAVRAHPRMLSGFSPDLAAKERTLKAFMYKRLYLHDEQVEAADKAREVVASLFASYADTPDLLPPEWQARLPQDETARARTIADFIAGMSDRFAIEQYRAIHGTVPAGLSNV